MEKTELPIRNKNKIHQLGTRIKFTKSLYGGATSESPACVYAEKDDGGVVTGHGCREGHWVKWDKWEHPFGAKLGEDFIVLKQKIALV